MNTKDTGNISEAFVKAHLLKAGYKVLLPFGDNCRYDLVIDLKGKFYRIQIKTASFTRFAKDKSALSFYTCSSQKHRNKGISNYKNSIDFFAAFNSDLGKSYLIPIKKVKTSTECVLRLKKTKNNQKSKVRLASDYEIRKGILEQFVG